MILRMTSMLRGIPLEKRGFLRRMAFMERTTDLANGLPKNAKVVSHGRYIAFQMAKLPY